MMATASAPGPRLLAVYTLFGAYWVAPEARGHLCGHCAWEHAHRSKDAKCRYWSVVYVSVEFLLRTLTAMQDAWRTNKEGKTRKSKFMTCRAPSLSLALFIFFRQYPKWGSFWPTLGAGTISLCRSKRSQPWRFCLSRWKLEAGRCQRWRWRLGSFSWSQEKDSTCKQPIIFSSWTRGGELIVAPRSVPKAVWHPAAQIRWNPAAEAQAIQRHSSKNCCALHEAPRIT